MRTSLFLAHVRPTPALLTSLAGLTLLVSCARPPSPPALDESSRRPANTAVAVALQACKSELRHATQMSNQLSQCRRQAEASHAALTSVMARQQALAAWAVQAPPGNRVFAVQFDLGSSHVDIPAGMGRLIVQQAKSAPWVVLRGRTDGTRDSDANGRLARERAAAVQHYLVAAGVAPSRIRVTYQPGADPAADDTPAGRALNRRVEIEIYQAPPVEVPASGEPQNTATGPSAGLEP